MSLQGPHQVAHTSTSTGTSDCGAGTAWRRVAGSTGGAALLQVQRKRCAVCSVGWRRLPTAGLTLRTSSSQLSSVASSTARTQVDCLRAAGRLAPALRRGTRRSAAAGRGRPAAGAAARRLPLALTALVQATAAMARGCEEGVGGAWETSGKAADTGGGAAGAQAPPKLLWLDRVSRMGCGWD